MKKRKFIVSNPSKTFGEFRLIRGGQISPTILTGDWALVVEKYETMETNNKDIHSEDERRLRTKFDCNV